MAQNNDALLKRLLATFRLEADDHLKAMASGLLSLEEASAEAERAAIVETVFREAHSLKGAARAVNLTAIEAVCRPLESVFAALKAGRLDTSPPLFDLLHRTLDALGALLAADPSGAGGLPATVAELTRLLDDAAQARPARASETRRKPDPGREADTGRPPMPAPVSSPTAGTVRIATAKLDAIMRQAEELLSPKLAAAERAAELREASTALAAWKKRRARVQPSLRRLERVSRPTPLPTPRAGERNGAAQAHGADGAGPDLPALLDYLDAEQVHLKTLEDRLARLVRASERDRRALAGVADDLLDEVKRMQLLPFSWLLEMFPRLVRDLARERGKEAGVTIQGGEIEIDRRILEELKDPLIHLIRNAVDHGIEPAAERTAAGKPAHGAIALSVAQTDSGKVEILIADDGAGIDADKVVAAARKHGLVPAEEAARLGPEQSLALVFRSGLSTSPIVTDVSGRGLGLAIVREKVERLGGMIALESQPGAGTRLRIVVPLTLATFRGVLVRAGERLCLVPAANLERAVRVRADEVRTVENRETIALGDQAVALASLADVLELPRPAASRGPADSVLALVLALGPARIAFEVDEVLGEQEVLLKPLGAQLARVRNIAGASILGSGQVVPVLNVPDLMRSAVRRATAPAAPPRAERLAPSAPRSVLVVEDSITSRALLKGILESAGYRVAVAVDGIDAYTALKTERFDLVVSDVEMPRMDGFDLTARIRADKHLAELPVVLVTALETREHRERGIEVGANAYIVKSSFDQSNLLEVVARLMP